MAPDPPDAVMLLSALVATLVLQATPAQIQRISWVPNPRRTDGTWVADPSHHLRDSTVRTLNAEIAALEQATGVEIAVVVVDSTSGLTPFDFALAIHRGWGVGKTDRDNGVVLLWVPAQRAIQISIGYGLEGVLPDRRVGRIRDQEIFPAFRRDAFDDGVLAGVRALAAAAREETSAREGITPRLQTDGGGGGSSVGLLVGLAGFLLVAALLLGVLFRRWRRNRPRKCPKCRRTMARLDEKADDAFLDKAERLEEKLHSVDYDVWKCPQCGETLKIPYAQRVTSVETCPKCKHRTLQITESVWRSATETREGGKTIISKCASCGHRDETSKTIPRVSSSSGSSSDSSWSSSDSGGGGSDFGGGSAGGGGAGGTY